jgi:aldehyde dehydrogenase (NAD+)
VRNCLSKHHHEVLKENNLPLGISNLVIGDAEIGDLMAKDTRVPLVSATGSTRMGKIVAQNVAARLGKSFLELGGKQCDYCNSRCRY